MLRCYDATKQPDLQRDHKERWTLNFPKGAFRSERWVWRPVVLAVLVAEYDPSRTGQVVIPMDGKKVACLSSNRVPAGSACHKSLVDVSFPFLVRPLKKKGRMNRSRSRFPPHASSCLLPLLLVIVSILSSQIDRGVSQRCPAQRSTVLHLPTLPTLPTLLSR
jgi:hypothetical protein